jgi:hypothetical protein
MTLAGSASVHATWCLFALAALASPLARHLTNGGETLPLARRIALAFLCALWASVRNPPVASAISYFIVPPQLLSSASPIDPRPRCFLFIPSVERVSVGWTIKRSPSFLVLRPFKVSFSASAQLPAFRFLASGWRAIVRSWTSDAADQSVPGDAPPIRFPCSAGTEPPAGRGTPRVCPRGPHSPMCLSCSRGRPRPATGWPTAGVFSYTPTAGCRPIQH